MVLGVGSVIINTFKKLRPTSRVSLEAEGIIL